MASSTRRPRTEYNILIDTPQIVLGRGFQSVVLKGSYSDQPVAVKRVSQFDALLATREELALRTFRHQNILKLLAVDETDEFKLFALELCAGTIEQFCKGHYVGPMPNDDEALYQMACGLEYIHRHDFIHRDIKPQNVLIFCPADSNTSVLKISDFGFCKPVNSTGSASMSNVKGTECWYAPELLQYLELQCLSARCNIRSDIFSMGCVFGYFLTRGTHPFGEQRCYIMGRIYEGKYDVKVLDDKYRPIVEGMIQKNAEDRSNLPNVCYMLQQLVPT